MKNKQVDQQKHTATPQAQSKAKEIFKSSASISEVHNIVKANADGDYAMSKDQKLGQKLLAG